MLVLGGRLDEGHVTRHRLEPGPCGHVLDDRSRLACHLQWYLVESTETAVHGLSQAVLKRGLPRAVMSDNGGAETSAEMVEGLERLGVVHHTTLPYHPVRGPAMRSGRGRPS